MDVPERQRFPGAAFLVAQFGIIVISPHRHLASSSSCPAWTITTITHKIIKPNAARPIIRTESSMRPNSPR
jgi:hypothetical protein